MVVITGDSRHLPDDKRTGAVLHVDRKKDRVTVEGVNVRKAAQKRSAQNPQGGFVEKECPIHISNVMLKSRFDMKFEDA